MKKILISIFFASAALLLPGLTQAHPGGTDAYGCHTCRTNCSSWGLYTGEYHCHQAKSYTQPEPPISSTYGSNGTGYTTPAPYYSAPSYTAPSTPTCPSMSSYNSLTGKCTCYSGYVAGTDYLGNQACVSAESKCSDQLGFGGTYDSLSGNCKCRSGYVLSNSKCVSEITYCTNSMGIMSNYNSFTKQCECMTGYEYNGSSCVYKKKNTCPINSFLDSDNTCTCNAGYEVNSNKSACIKSCSQNETRIGNLCFCKNGYERDSISSNCVASININKTTNDTEVEKTGDQLCKEQYGFLMYSNNIKNSDGRHDCYCISGFDWNGSKCVLHVTKKVKLKESLILRELPNEKSKKIASIKKNSEYEITDLSNKSWIKIKVNGKEGFVMKKFVSIK